MQKRRTESYSIEQSPLYRMGRGRDLCSLLKLSRKELVTLIVQRSGRYKFEDGEVNGKMRHLAVPLGRMRSVHERIKNILTRISFGPYLYSPRKGKTAFLNAVQHITSEVVVKIDVKQFYPSTTEEHVFQFFVHRMRMVDDVAARLTKICTVNGIVPFGSPLSPILCALVHDDAFSYAARLCELDGNLMTVWVDDITLSGFGVKTRLVELIENRIRAKRLIPHKTERFNRRDGVVITGTYINKDGTAPSNKSHIKFREKLVELKDAETNASKVKIVESLIGMARHQLSISEGPLEERLRRRLQWLHNHRRYLQSQPIVGAEYAKLIVASQHKEEAVIETAV